MNFKIVSAGWNCAGWLEQTLRSVEQQTLENWEVWITYDPSEDSGASVIRDWCDSRDDRWHYTINTERKYAIRNQHESIIKLDPADDDVIVFLDLDGDQLAHPEVLERLKEAYEDGALITYGQYEPVPNYGTSVFAKPYPAEVVVNNSYRTYHLYGGDTCFNHLRTISGRIFRSIPEDMFKWTISGNTITPRGTFSWNAGEWYLGSADYVFMISALERAGGNYRCFNETLLLYNHDNPYADNKVHAEEAEICIANFFSRPALCRIEHM